MLFGHIQEGGRIEERKGTKNVYIEQERRTWSLTGDKHGVRSTGRGPRNSLLHTYVLITLHNNE